MQKHSNKSHRRRVFCEQIDHCVFCFFRLQKFVPLSVWIPTYFEFSKGTPKIKHKTVSSAFFLNHFTIHNTITITITITTTNHNNQRNSNMPQRATTITSCKHARSVNVLMSRYKRLACVRQHTTLWWRQSRARRHRHLRRCCCCWRFGQNRARLQERLCERIDIVLYSSRFRCCIICELCALHDGLYWLQMRFCFCFVAHNTSTKANTNNTPVLLGSSSIAFWRSLVASVCSCTNKWTTKHRKHTQTRYMQSVECVSSVCPVKRDAWIVKHCLLLFEVICEKKNINKTKQQTKQHSKTTDLIKCRACPFIIQRIKLTTTCEKD